MSEPRTWRDAALILRTQKLGETDRIIIMLTRDGGITHAVAKAVRKPTSKFGGRLEPFMHTDLSFSRGRTNLHTITQAATLHAYTAPIMANYDAYTCASTIAELAEALTKDTDSTADIYTLTHGALAALAHGQHVPQRILTRYLARSFVLPTRRRSPAPAKRSPNWHAPSRRCRSPPWMSRGFRRSP
mgnify:CR=1 FL=1